MSRTVKELKALQRRMKAAHRLRTAEANLSKTVASFPQDKFSQFVSNYWEKTERADSIGLRVRHGAGWRKEWECRKFAEPLSP